MFFSLLLVYRLLTYVFGQIENELNGQNILSSQNEPDDSELALLRGCESQLARIHHSTDRHVFTGCRLSELTDVDETLRLILDISNCDRILGGSNTTSFVQNFTLETTNAKKSVKGCIMTECDVILIIATVVRNRDKSLTAYFERKQLPKNLLPLEYQEATYKVLPRINVKLPADFFYPFSCHGHQTGLGSALLLALFVPLTRLLL